MDKIGVSFKSELSRNEIHSQYVQPLRTAIEQAGEGIFSNYLRQTDTNPHEPAEHLLIFEVKNFKQGLKLVRTAMESVGIPEGMLLHNLNSSSPGY